MGLTVRDALVLLVTHGFQKQLHPSTHTHTERERERESKRERERER
jgi:hypothetical protein